MKKELNYFKIGNSHGGQQAWFSDYMMNIGGCAAVTACDMCIYLDLYKNTKNLYPFNEKSVTKEDYINFSKIMKHYLRPRIGGISRLEIYLNGFGRYLRDRLGNSDLILESLHGHKRAEKGKQAVIKQIDAGIPVPYLLLRHKSPPHPDYVWHWFLLTGYKKSEDSFMVKAVTYGTSKWIDFDNLWDTGYRMKGGMILLSGI